MTNAERAVKIIQEVLDSDLSSYMIAKEVGYASANPVHKMRDGKTDIKDLKVGTAIEFEKLYDKINKKV